MNRSKEQRSEKPGVKLGDLLNDDLVAKLKSTKKDLRKREKEQIAAEQARKRKEREQREKNKTFEQLLAESDLDWKQFK